MVIFCSYLLLSSLFLFNQKGGADILFIMLMAICIFIHSIVVIFKLIKDRKNATRKGYTQFDLIVFVGLVVGFFSLFDQYLRLMWRITS